MNKTEEKFDWKTADRKHQVALFVIGMIDKLKEKGFVEGGAWKCTPEGMATVDEMELASQCGEWEPPTMKEIQGVIGGLNAAATR